MIICIHQPSYFPWLGLLDKIARTDKCIILDNVQVNKDALQYRNIFYCNGKAKHITLPVNYRQGIRFDNLEFKNPSWPESHLNYLRNYYLKAPFFTEVFPDLEKLFKSFTSMTPLEVIIRSMEFCSTKLNIRSRLYKSSVIGFSGTKGAMVLELCHKTEATEYVAGKGSRKYMQSILSAFNVHGIDISWQNFSHPIYKQHPKFEFIPGLSSLDLFFFMGYQEAQKIFWKNVEKHPSLKQLD